MDVTTWEAMIVAEPALKQLEADIDAVGTAFDMSWDERGLPWATVALEVVWARAFKPRVAALVGYQARLACLQSSASYDVAVDRLYDRLMVHVGQEAAR